MWTEGQLLQSGKYKILRRISGGGFGLTYLATDSFLSRKVVIKTPNDTFQADQDYERYIRRFRREAQTILKIQHPNVVDVLSIFKESGMPCLVMAYVEGETLYERLRNGTPLAEAEALRIFRKLASALHQAHKAGIFHCDVHPGNIMLQHNGEPILIDFGSAKYFQPATVTVTTTVNQSFSPYEQHNPKNKPKATLDVYGLTATLFFAVTGTRPPSSVGRKLYGIAFKLPRTLEPNLSPWLRKALLTGMALEEQDRPSDMRSLAKLLHPPQKVKSPVKTLTSIKEVSEEKVIRSNKDVSEPQNTINSVPSKEHAYSKLFFVARTKTRRQESMFPFLLGLFLLSNAFTGSCMWLIAYSFPSIESWEFVFICLLSMVSTGLITNVQRRSFFCALAALILVVGTLTLFSGKAILSGFAVGMIAVIGTWAGYRGWALGWRMGRPPTESEMVDKIEETWMFVEVFGIILVLFMVVSSLPSVMFTGPLSGMAVGTLGSIWLGLSARSVNADWAGIGGSSTGLSGLIVGLFAGMPGSADLSGMIFIIGLVQMAAAIMFLQPTVSSLSTPLYSKNQAVVVLNSVPILGMLFGVGFVWWLSYI